jgi:hypothetical protein
MSPSMAMATRFPVNNVVSTVLEKKIRPGRAWSHGIESSYGHERDTALRLSPLWGYVVKGRNVSRNVLSCG